jgi:hypothetical protein
MRNLPDQPTQAVGDRANGLGVSTTRDEPAIQDGEIVPLAFTAALTA